MATVHCRSTDSKCHQFPPWWSAMVVTRVVTARSQVVRSKSPTPPTTRATPHLLSHATGHSRAALILAKGRRCDTTPWVADDTRRATGCSKVVYYFTQKQLENVNIYKDERFKSNFKESVKCDRYSCAHAGGHAHSFSASALLGSGCVGRPLLKLSTFLL